MKNSRLCKVLSKRHIPADLWPDILSRLAVKSLLRFRCVSKSWLSLVDDAEFARLHLNNFKNNCDETHLLVVHGRQQNCVVRCSDTFETNSETPLVVTLGHDCIRDESWDIVCCVDGLILLSHYTGTGTFNDLKVWNPSIRKLSELPSLPKIRTSPNIYLKDADIGLGYDPLANDYKLVKLIFLNYETLHSVAIYSLGAGSWKTIEFQGKGSSCSNWRWGRGCSGRSVYLQGSLYFIARDAHNDCVRDLVTFDLSSEVFSSISMPDNPYGFTGCNQLALIDGGCSLATFDTSLTSVDKSVWVLGSESMKWTKRAEFRLKCIQFLYLKKNGDILIRRCRGETFTDETGEKKSVRWDQVISYSPGTDEYKIVQERRGSFYVISHVCGYVESLIQHK